MGSEPTYLDMAEWPVEREGINHETFVKLCRDNALVDPAICTMQETPYVDVPRTTRTAGSLTSSATAQPSLWT